MTEKLYIKTQIAAGLAGSLAFLCGGFHYGWSSPTLPKLLAGDAGFSVTSDQASWIASISTFGCAFGPIMVAMVVDRLGRKPTLLLTTIPYGSACILIALAQSHWWLYAARFLAGISTGASYTILPMYVGEIADDKIRGALSAMIGHMLNVGILVPYCIGPWVSGLVLALIGLTVTVLFMVAVLFVPESPYFLVMKKKLDRATESLMWLKGSTEVSEDLKNIENNVNYDQQTARTLKRLLLVPGSRKALAIVTVLMVAQQFSGIAAVLSYTSLIFEASGAELSSSISAIIIGLVRLIGGVLAIATVDLAGRRPLLFISMCGSILFLIGVALYFQLQADGRDVSSISWLPMTATIGYVLSYSIGMGCVPFVVLSEFFSSEVKAIALMITIIVTSLSGMAVVKLYQVVADAYGIHAPFWGFAVVSTILSIIIYFILPETKRRSLSEIQNELNEFKSSEVAPDKPAA